MRLLNYERKGNMKKTKKIKCLFFYCKQAGDYVAYCANTGSLAHSVRLDVAKMNLVNYLQNGGLTLALRNKTYKNSEPIGNQGELVKIEVSE